MTPDDILTRVADQLSIRRVFGEVVRRGEVDVIPVAVVIGGGGAGTDASEGDSGGGFGGIVRGIGVYTVADGKVRYVPAIDVTALAAIGAVLAGLLLSTRRRRSPRR